MHSRNKLQPHYSGLLSVECERKCTTRMPMVSKMKSRKILPNLSHDLYIIASEIRIQQHIAK